MKNVSEEFLKATKSQTREFKARASFEIVEEGVRSKVASYASSSNYYPTRTHVYDGIRYNVKVFTCEKNHTKLDGTYRVAPDNYDGNGWQTGWWSSNISNAECTINEYIELTMSETINLPGIGIVFTRYENVYAENFDIYINDTKIKSVTGNTKEFYRIIFDEGYRTVNKIKIVITKTNKPFQRARITEIDLGLIEEYTDDDILSMEITDEMDYSSSTLPIKQCKIKIDNSNNRFDILNPQGIYAYVKENQKVFTQLGAVLEDGSIEWVDTGMFYLDTIESDAAGLSATLNCQGLFKMCESETADNWRAIHNATIWNFANRYLRINNDLISRTYLTGDSTQISNTNNILVNEFLDPLNVKSIASYVSIITNIQFIDISSKANGNRIGLRLLEKEVDTGYVIDLNNEHEYPVLTNLNPVKSVALNCIDRNTWASGAKLSEFVTLTITDRYYTVLDLGKYYYKPTLANSDDTLKITYIDNDVWKLHTDYEGYYTCSKLYIKRKNGKGDVTLSNMILYAIKANENKYVYTKSISSKTGDALSINLPMLQPNETYANRILMKQLTKPTKKITCNWRGNPALQVGDRIKIEDKYNTLHDCILTKQTLTYDGGLTSNIEAYIKPKNPYTILISIYMDDNTEKSNISIDNRCLLECDTSKYIQAISADIENVEFEYMVHESYSGDSDWYASGHMFGKESADEWRIEGIAFRKVINTPSNLVLNYRVYLSGLGWSVWKTWGEFCGTRGEARSIEKIEMKVTEA